MALPLAPATGFAPAFEAENAYSHAAEDLFFGYFASADGKQVIYTLPSHEIVAHETTHALLDGLRQRYTNPIAHGQPKKARSWPITC